MSSVFPGAVAVAVAYRSPYNQVRLKNVIIGGVRGGKKISDYWLSQIIVASALVTWRFNLVRWRPPGVRLASDWS